MLEAQRSSHATATAGDETTLADSAKLRAGPTPSATPLKTALM